MYVPYAGPFVPCLRSESAVGQALPYLGPLRPTISVPCVPCRVRLTRRVYRERRHRDDPLVFESLLKPVEIGDEGGIVLRFVGCQKAIRKARLCLLIYSSSLPYLIIFFSLAPESAYRAYRNFQHLLMSVGFVCLPLDCLLQRYIVGFMIYIIAIILLDITGLLKGLTFFTRLAYT